MRPNYRIAVSLAIAFGIANLLAGTAGNRPIPASTAAVLVSESDFRPFEQDRAALGRLLFYDPILSGNRNISCGTCHHHSLASADGLPLGIGEGGTGIGSERSAPPGRHRIKRRMSRNSPALFNLGANEFRQVFHDGRISVDEKYGNGFDTPAEEFLPNGLSSVLAAQSLFPIIGEIEMGGSPDENRVAAAVNERLDYGWPLIVERIRGIPEYAELFGEAYADIRDGAPLTIVHVANAIGDFVGAEWRSFDSPFDRFLAGDENALTEDQHRGMLLFFGKGECSTCHGGKFFTDHGFHALAVPPLGPGRTRKFDLLPRDVGRMGESDALADAYRFRTPTLRNVALTAPYGHNGAFPDLNSVIAHHVDPLGSLSEWRPDSVALPDADWLEDTDFIVHDDRIEMTRFRAALDIEPVELDAGEIDDLVDFLKALTGEESVHGRLGRPESVPSGLPVD